MAQQRLYEAEAEVEARNWKKRNSDIVFQEINQEFESQRFQLLQASRWADQAQRDKISLYGELECRNKLFQEYHARDCQEIEELRRICCEETDLARQARTDELSMHQERNAAIVSQLLAQSQKPCRAAILDCRVTHKIALVPQETFLNDLLLKKDYPLQSSTTQKFWHHPVRNSGLILSELQGEERVK